MVDKKILIAEKDEKHDLDMLFLLLDTKKELEDKIKVIQENLKTFINGDGVLIDNETGFKVSVSTSTKKGGVDLDKTKEANPDIKIIYKKDSEVITFRTHKSKVGVSNG